MAWLALMLRLCAQRRIVPATAELRPWGCATCTLRSCSRTGYRASVRSVPRIASMSREYTPGTDLPPPAVPPAAYDEGYYRGVCLGADDWQTSDGTEMHPIYPAMVAMAEVGSGDRVVDVGCGRGELLIAACQAGAARATGIEYSPAAVQLAQETIDTHRLSDRCNVIQADARAIPLDDSCAERVTMIDLVEHLTPVELGGALKEAMRMLSPGGRLLIHTMPNRLIYTVTYRTQRLILPWRLWTWPANPRNEHERLMHVNEQTVRRLRRALVEGGFEQVQVRLGSWIPDYFQPRPRHVRLYGRLARLGPLAHLGIADIFAAGERPQC